jgi:cytosine/adenosine deaminase-related metal-dependent hydrolase
MLERMAPQPVDTLILHGVVITVDAGRRIFADGAVAIAGSRIVEVGRSADLEPRYRARRTIDARGAVVRPGFVDAHVHLSHHLGRGSIPDVWPEEREHTQWLPYWLELTERDSYLSALLACLEMACNGTTAFSDMSGRHSAGLRARAAAEVGLRGLVSEICWDIPPHPEVAEGDTGANVRRLERLIAAYPAAPEALVWAGVAMTGMGKCSDALVVAGHDLARRSGLPFTMHQSFGAADTAAFERRTGGRTAVEHLERLGVLGPETSLVHMNVVTDGEAELIARTGTAIVHCPGASVRVGMGTTRQGRFPEMAAAGVPVALGSDSGNYSDFFDVGRQAYLAATIHREFRGVMPTITAEQALEMATIHGARVLGATDRIGSIEAGKLADLVVHSASRPEWHPGVDPVNSLVYSAQSNGIDRVLVGGEVVVEGGRPVRLDLDAALREIDAAARSLFERMGYRVEERWPITD